MLTFIAIVHLLVAVVLIFLVLIQDSKGGAMGSMLGGGSSNSLLGATGATSFLVKVTRFVAVIFAATCIALTMMSGSSKSVIDGYLPPAASDQNTNDASTDSTNQMVPEKTEDSKGNKQ